MSEFFPAPLSTTQLKEVAAKAWIWSIVRGGAAVVFGIIAFAAPLKTALVLAIVVGLLAIVDGIVDIIDAVRYRGSAGMTSRIVLGVLSIAFGLVVLFWPGLSLELLAVIIGIWAIVAGLLQIAASAGHRGSTSSGWVWGLIAGALSIVFGVLVVIRPAGGVITLMWILGFYALLFGIALIVFGVQMRKFARTDATVTR